MKNISKASFVGKVAKKVMVTKKVIFIDWDGTIIDFLDRLYALHRDICASLNIPPFAKNKYLTLKRNRVKESDLIHKLTKEDKKVNTYMEQRLKLIESPIYLRLDKLIPRNQIALTCLAEAYAIILITNRKSKMLLYKQLDGFNVSNIFTDILITEHKITKEELIKSHKLFKDAILLVGDTDEDVILAKKLGLDSAVVLTGLLDKKNATIMKPTHIFNNISDLEKKLRY